MFVCTRAGCACDRHASSFVCLCRNKHVHQFEFMYVCSYIYICVYVRMRAALDAHASNIQVVIHGVDCLSFSVLDNGCGIHPRDMQLLGTPHGMSIFEVSVCV